MFNFTLRDKREEEKTQIEQYKRSLQVALLETTRKKSEISIISVLNVFFFLDNLHLLRNTAKF